MSPSICKFKRRQFCDSAITVWITGRKQTTHHHFCPFVQLWLPHRSLRWLLDFIPFTHVHISQPFTSKIDPILLSPFASPISGRPYIFWCGSSLVQPTEHSTSASASHYYWLVKLCFRLMVIMYLDHYFSWVFFKILSI